MAPWEFRKASIQSRLDGAPLRCEPRSPVANVVMLGCTDEHPKRPATTLPSELSVPNMPNCSARRSSVFASAGGARVSMMPGFSATSIKDPRPIRDRTFQHDCFHNIQEYFAARGFGSLSNNPTQKDFQQAFKFLADDLVGPGLPWNKKFEDDCLAMLKDLKYPALDTLGKTALGAAGSERNWPLMLAMLNWMVSLCKVYYLCCQLLTSRRRGIGMILTSFQIPCSVPPLSSQLTIHKLRRD